MLHTTSQILVGLVALIHIYVLALEMFFWTKPLGLKVFGHTQEDAKTSATLAANQGLYNGFLSMGLIASYFFNSADIRLSFQLFFLASVLLAGIYGSLTTGPKVGPRIFVIQALPAALGLLCLLFSH
ncbi:MAG: DUF1304 domain-containing protein [Bdellovibrionota bacterium]